MSARGVPLSIREISRRIGIPESTLRYYRNLFPNHIPTLGSGRNRRHPEHAVAVFRLISELFARGASREAIHQRLKQPAGEGSQAGSVGTETLLHTPEVQSGPDVERPVDVRIARGQDGLGSGELKQLVAALLVRDRELTKMHRDLLGLVGRLIGTLEGRIDARSEVEVERPPRERAARDVEAQPEEAPVAEPEPGREGTQESAQIEQLRASLERERQMVERLRRAKLEIEQRLARLERESGGRSR